MQELSSVTEVNGQIQALTAFNQEKDARYVGVRDWVGRRDCLNVVRWQETELHFCFLEKNSCSGLVL